MQFNQLMKPGKRKEILDKFNNSCVNCGATSYLQIDHIIPLSLGGTNDDDNFQTLCKKCNCSKGGKRSPGAPKKDIAERYRIEIAMPSEILIELACLSDKENRSLKNYIETILIEHVKEQKKS